MLKEYRKHTKRHFFQILCLSVMILSVSLGMVGCGKRKKPKDSLEENVQNGLYDEGLLLIEQMQMLTKDRGYVANVGLPSTLQDEYERLLLCPYDKLTDVYRVSHLEDATDTFIAIAGQKMEESSKLYFRQKMASSMANMVISYTAGATQLALAGLLAQEDYFVNAELVTSEVYIYCYEDSYPVLVGFTPGKGGAVKANATYLISDKLINVSPEELGDAVRGYFNATSLECITK